MNVDRRGFLKALAGLPLAVGAWAEAKRDVILCFDGSGPLDKWRRVLELGDRLRAATGTGSFTVFACGAQLVERMPGSTIGAGGSRAECDERLQLIQTAIQKGHELGNHTVRHKNGQKWSEQQWFDELGEFDRFAAEFFTDKGGKPYKPVGFRAPYLAWNPAMYQALERLGYLYDVSQVGDFTTQVGRIVVKGMPLYARDSGRKIGGMDYNWYIAGIHESEAERMLNRKAEQPDTEPVVISLHFSDYGHGSRNYFQVVSDFMVSVAKKGGYRFVSMIDHLRDTGTVAPARQVAGDASRG
jgi:hypothetical protein